MNSKSRKTLCQISNLNTVGLFVLTAFITLTISIPRNSRADSKPVTTLSYLIGFPSGDTKDFVSDPSFLGFEADFSNLYQGTDEWGLVIGWQRFKKNLSNSQYTDANSGLTVTADQERSLSSAPILLKWRHYFPNEEKIKPFLGTSAGVSYVERRFFVGFFDFSEYGWQVLLRPEAGVKYALNDHSSLVTSLRYDYGFKNGDLPSLGVLSIGLGWQLGF